MQHCVYYNPLPIHKTIPIFIDQSTQVIDHNNNFTSLPLFEMKF